MKPILLLLLYVAYMNLVFANSQQNDGPISPDLKLVATADGKSFYADSIVTRDWTEAGEYCSSQGMILADISSKSQADALQAAYTRMDFDGWFWTSGRDTQTQKQFVWNSTGHEISNEYPDFYAGNLLEYQTCVYYFSLPGSASALYYYKCSYKMGTLCNTFST